MEWSAAVDLFFKTGISQMAKMTVEKLIEHYKSSKYDFINERCEEIISEYLQKSYETNAIMNTIVFRGEKKTLFDLYIPLTISSKKKDVNEQEKIKIDENAISNIESYKKIMIVDNAGMGKSTIAKYLSIQSVINETYIPIIVELRKLNKEKTIWKYFCELFDMLDKSIEYEDIRKLVKRGNFMIIFDGYDEIPDYLRVDIISQIKEFTKKADENIYILTSREEEELSTFGDFREFQIDSLKIQESYELINKYGKAGQRAERLINAIKEEKTNFKVLKEFLVNPLLVSLLYKTYEYKEELSYKKVEFYRQVYEALYNDHDKSKDAYVHPKKSGLAIREFEAVLRYLAFFSMQKWKVEYESIHELLINVEKALQCVPGIENVNGEAFVNDIVHAVPLFQCEGNAYRWVHKSFMEYFSAQCIWLEIPQKQKNGLIEQMSDKNKGTRYYNILDFYYDLDYKTFRNNVVIPFLEKYINTFEHVRNEFQKENIEVSEELIFLETALRFFYDYKIIYIKFDTSKIEATKLFKDFEKKYGKASMTYHSRIGILWHRRMKENISIPRLLEEKGMQIKWINRNNRDSTTTEEKYIWLKEICDDVGYIDKMVTILKKTENEQDIRALYYENVILRKIECLDVTKVKNMLKKMKKEIEQERETNDNIFSYLEID